MEYGLSADVYVNISFTLFIFHTYSILFNLMFRKKEKTEKGIESIALACFKSYFIAYSIISLKNDLVSFRTELKIV